MVLSATERLLDDHATFASAWREAGLPFEKFSLTTAAIKQRSMPNIANLIKRVEISASGLNLTVCLASLIFDGPTLVHHVPMTVRRRGVEMRLVLDNEKRRPDPVLLSAVARGRRWFGELARGEAATMVEIAKRDGLSAGRVNQLTKLAFLSPKIVQAIIDGRQPVDLTTKTFSRLEILPVGWAEQEALLGF
jgi:hypothetical protein